MKKKLLSFVVLVLSSYFVFAQSGHLMQGVGAFNMSMGGASTGQPLDINGALQWNPAAISVFNKKILSVDVGLLSASPTIYSTVPTPDGNMMSGATKDVKGISPLPSIAMVWGNNESKNTFGVSIFGVSGFGVDFPKSNNNPITLPQNMHGFGHLESNYMLLQVGFTYAYQISEKFSIGIEPTLNYSSLMVKPNPLATPNQTKGYPTSETASAIGFGGQIGVFYNSGKGFKLGVSYKTQQFFDNLEFENKYLDGSAAPTNAFKMNFPAIVSVGAGYSAEKFDVAIDYRRVFYESTDGFKEKGWSNTGSVLGFGWTNMNIVSAGLQLKLINKLPLRLGYTYSSNPIVSELAMYSVEAPAVIENAFQFGIGFEINEKLTLNGTFHYGSSNGKTTGALLNPMMATSSNPYGAIPSSKAEFDMATNMIMFGLNYTFSK